MHACMCVPAHPHVTDCTPHEQHNTKHHSTTSDILSGRMRATGALSIMSTVYTSTYLTANYTAAACKASTHAALLSWGGLTECLGWSMRASALC